ncbi:8-amino-7-oxononanoate synthase [Lacisediminimonas profundi]|uniref:8-amino-7-oxononanoate synthase n=1 Tax=Lacisediminimonas profundi TaxID=2603856 RepID=UPI00124AFBBE|nr:8-amino-7-oxononanoate synthase [Lacisediminimonas profundi]
MELLDRLQRQLDQLDEAQLLRRRRVVATPCAPEMLVDGRRLLAFCSNDYLGLANHPEVVEALAEGARVHGAGSGASHLINGHSRAHVALEERFADWLSAHIPCARALTFSTGYMANMGLLTALGGPEAELFSEELNHASLIDGARLSRSAVRVYPHGDIDALAGLLAQSRAAVKIVVTDGVFSMDGDIAPLPAMLQLCERHGALLVVDDAHGFGVLGARGRGVLSHFGLRSPHLVYVGTLGKAAGVAGAFVAAHDTVIEWLAQRSRQYIFTTASPPALAHALMKSLDLIEGEEGEQRRLHLRALIAQVKQELCGTRWRLLDSDTAIQPVIVGSNGEVQRVAAALQEQGLWVGAIRPPTVPPGSARLRITLSAAHTAQQAGRLTSALRALDSAVPQEAP